MRVKSIIKKNQDMLLDWIEQRSTGDSDLLARRLNFDETMIIGSAIKLKFGGGAPDGAALILNVKLTERLYYISLIYENISTTKLCCMVNVLNDVDIELLTFKNHLNIFHATPKNLHENQIIISLDDFLEYVV